MPFRSTPIVAELIEQVNETGVRQVRVALHAASGRLVRMIRAISLACASGEDQAIVDTSVMRNGLPPQQVMDALAGACAEAGIAVGARLMRMHSNTVFYLPASNAVARINSGMEGGARRVAASLTATQWLAQKGSRRYARR